MYVYVYSSWCRTLTQGLKNMLSVCWSKTVQNNLIVAAIVLADIVRIITMTFY